jgi:diaminohydroxyphosphoribosylaminopyrimidine deaminase/5-amino-6-(5-phosphoribosylamino)uracil reductase
MYVTLEPCVHWGRTPPCVEAIKRAEIERLVVAVTDPDPRVHGAGLDELARSGIKVELGCREPEAADLLMPYFKQRLIGLPYVHGKVAMTVDAKVADSGGVSKWITGPSARESSHLIRESVQAVVVGSRTYLIDQPSLDARFSRRRARRQPERWVMSRSGDLNLREGFSLYGGEPRQFLIDRAADGVLSLLVEGGPTLIGSFLADQLIDQLELFIAPAVMGGPGLEAFAFREVTSLADLVRGRFGQIKRVGEDLWISLLTPEGLHFRSQVAGWLEEQKTRFDSRAS